MDLTLIAIVLGLDLTELLLSFYSAVRARRRVSWDALPLAWALVILVAVVNFWYAGPLLLTKIDAQISSFWEN